MGFKSKAYEKLGLLYFFHFVFVFSAKERSAGPVLSWASELIN
jgi:hypothetical protein